VSMQQSFFLLFALLGSCFFLHTNDLLLLLELFRNQKLTPLLIKLSFLGFYV